MIIQNVTLTNVGYVVDISTVVPGLIYNLDAANYAALPTNGSLDATGTYTISVSNGGSSLSYNSGSGGYFSKSNSTGTDVIYGGPNYTSTSQSYTVFMAYDVNTTSGGRLLNTQSESTNDWLLGAYYNGSYNKNVFYPASTVWLSGDTYTGSTGWNFIWGTYDATTYYGNLYIASGSVNNTVGPTSTYKSVSFGASAARGFNQLRLFSRSAATEVQSGNIGFVKVYNGVLTVSQIQTLWSQNHSRFGI